MSVEEPSMQVEGSNISEEEASMQVEEPNISEEGLNMVWHIMEANKLLAETVAIK